MSEKLLYDIVQLLEWPVEEIKNVEENKNKGALRSTYDFLLSNYKRTFHLLRLAGLPYKQANSHAIVQALNQTKQKKKWTFSISPTCTFIAILQTQKVELRIMDDNLTIAGSCNISPALSHDKQVVAWNKESTLFGVAVSNQYVSLFDISCTMLCTIKLSGCKEVSNQPSLNICTIILMPARTQKEFWKLELFVLLDSGLLLNYFISNDGEFKLYHTFNFGSNYPQGITSAFMDTTSRLLVIGGNSYSGYSTDDEITADMFGITKWRILSDNPYYKKDRSESTTSKGHLRRSLMQRAYLYTTNVIQRIYSTPMDGVFYMCLSPDQNKLIAVHFNGSLSLWDFPSLRLRSMWTLEQQPHYDDVNPSMSSRFGRKRRRNDTSPINSHPYDVSWWNNDSVIVSRCSGCLTILSVSDRDLNNLLGSQCEWVTPCCSVTSANEGRLYMLECHNTYSNSNKRRKIDNKEGDDVGDYDDDEVDEDDSLFQKGLHFVKLFMGKTKSKQNESFSSKHSLVALTKTTPQELYDRKLDDKEFGEALSIAQTYNLDCDKVFQRQWKNAPISRASIQDYLAKVSNRLWVFRECTDRVPDRIDDMKELIEFALGITDIDMLARIGNKSNLNPKIEVLEDYEGFDYELQQQREIEKRLHFEKQWKEHVDFVKLSLEQREMIKCRQRVLKYKDRLSTYIRLNGGQDAANERYTADKFAVFRKRDFFQLALEYARSSQWEAVDTLLQYHSDQLKPHWLPLLSNFPETMSPGTYICLLPEIVDGKVVELLTFKHRSVFDWSETIDSSPTMLEVDDFYEENKDLKKFRTEHLSAELVSDWFQHRAIEMEELSHLTEDALCLIDLGMQRGVVGLSQLRFDLKTLDNLLFECGCDLALNLNGLLKKTPLERIRLMMAQSVATSYVDDIQRIVIPFVKKFEGQNLFQSYLLEVAEKDLILPLVVFKHILTHVSTDFDFKNTSHVIETAIGCIYAKEEANQLDIATRILNCILKLDGADNKALKEEVATVQRNLESCQILAKYKLLVTPNELRKIADDKKQISLLYKRLTRTQTREKPLTEAQCENLIEDMNSLAHKMFRGHVDKVACIHVLIESLLASGIEENIRLAGDKMIRSENESLNARMGNRLPYKDSVSLVLSASREFFDAASIPLSDSKLIQTSRLCLLLITDHPPVIQEQMNLIEAVFLLSAFQLQMLPLEVRLCKDRLKIVEKVLDLDPKNYLKTESILRLSSFLSDNTVSEEEHRGRTLCLIASRAFDNGDMKTATDVIKNLINMNHAQCWKLCAKIALCKEIADLKLRHSCISFACCYCDEKELIEISNALRSITASLLEETLEEEMTKTEEYQDDEKLEGPGLVPSLLPGSHTWKTSAQLLAGTMHATTGVLRSGWSMLKHDRVLSEPFFSHRDDASEQKKDFEIPSFPSFYKSILDTADNDLYDVITGNPLINSSSLATAQQQLMLRISSLASMSERMLESLKSLAPGTLTRDLPLGLSYLLSLPGTQAASECFLSLPFSSLSQQAQVYYHALQTLSKSFDLSSQILPLYRLPPGQLIDQSIKNCYNTDSPHELHRAVNSLVTFIQGERLSSLEQNVDMLRCSTDSQYVQEVVQGLAMTTNEEQLLVAILLADQKSCDIWEVAITYVEHLFTETDKPLDADDLLNNLNRLKLLPLLISKKESLYHRFDSRVLPLIDGRSHSTMLSYFRILTECEWEKKQSFESSNDICSLPPEEHISYLKRISVLAPRLDYKLLASKRSSGQVMQLLEEHLNSENVAMFSEIVPNLPYQNDRIKKSAVILCWLRKHFWSNEDQINYEGDWIKKLESLSDLFQQLDVDDTRTFFEDVLFSKKSIELFSYKLRSQILKFAIRTVKNKGNALNSSDFLSYKDELEGLRSHFNVFSNPFMRDIIKSAEHDFKKRKFLDEFDRSRSQLDYVIPIAVDQTYNSIEFTKKFLAVLPHLKLSFNQVFKTCNADMIERLSKAKDESTRKSALSHLERLLSSIGDCDEKEKSRLFNAVVSAIQDFCSLDSVEISLKIDVLQLLRKSAALSRKQTEFLLRHRTSEMISIGWGEEVARELLPETEKISNEDFQRRLVTSLLDRGSSLDQVKKLSSIVDVLTQDRTGSSSYDDMWLDVLTAFAQHEHAGGSEIVDEAKKRSFSSKVALSVFKALSSKSLVLAAIKFALLTGVSNSHNDIKELLQAVTVVDSTNCDDELLRFFIDKNVVELSLSTLYYHRVVEYLTDGKYENAEEKVDSLVRQLQDSDHISEAATLLLRFRGSHVTFATFGTSISLISNWLKNF